MLSVDSIYIVLVAGLYMIFYCYFYVNISAHQRFLGV